MGQVEATTGTRYLLDSEGGIVLQLGQEIPVGARIGRVGMTGRTTGPHLHWSLIYGGNYIDPALVLDAMFQRAEAS
jgi:murein DD-endopeptidase MepM/ murein hydrolase activator NlpD